MKTLQRLVWNDRFYRKTLAGQRIDVLAADGFEQVAPSVPITVFKAAGDRHHASDGHGVDGHRAEAVTRRHRPCRCRAV